MFVCGHNAGRSQMAEAFLNQLAKGQVRAISAGTEPAKTLNPTVVAAMREVGIDISQQQPKGLTPEMAEQADRVITMGCGVEGTCPAVATEDWGLADPAGQPIEKVRDIREQIRAKVVKLLEEYRPAGITTKLIC